jgi:hypothetical protein
MAGQQLSGKPGDELFLQGPSNGGDSPTVTVEPLVRMVLHHRRMAAASYIAPTNAPIENKQTKQSQSSRGFCCLGSLQLSGSII